MRVLNRYLLCCGDATNPATASNTPYFLLQAGLKRGFLQGGLALNPQRLRFKGKIWNLRQALTTGKPGGYQYSRSFTSALMAEACLTPSQPQALLSHFPLLPCHPWPSNWRVDFYIDATTQQIFADYGTGDRLAPAYRQQVLERERQAYRQAGFVVCMCQWAADSVIHHYGINPAKVYVVPGGANLDEVQLAQLAPAPPPLSPSAEHPLRLGFLGKDWWRKGGPFLLQLTEALLKKGIPAVIRAIGPDPAQLPSHPSLEPLGFIDKQRDTERFVAELRSWHFGTLFSDAEASPRSNLECLRLGVPLLTHDVGGILSTLPDAGCGQLFSPHPSAVEVANWLSSRLTPYQAYLVWRQQLCLRSNQFTWDQAAVELAAILN